MSLMRRNVSQFGWLILFAGTLLVETLLSAPACYSGQNQQETHGQQPGQPATPPQQQQPPAATPPRPTSSPDSSQDPSQESSSKKALPPDDPAPTKSSADAAKKSKPGVLPPADDPAWDPFHAQQDVDVGMFYLHKGDVDAAITRFEDAIRLRANFAKPRLLLAEAYERKSDPSEALRYYREYLQVLPNAPDAKKIREKIEKLSKK
jgi:tetratricopeptide (TPR) repeat protein